MDEDIGAFGHLRHGFQRCRVARERERAVVEVEPVPQRGLDRRMVD